MAATSLESIGRALNDRGISFTEGRGRRWGPGCNLDWNPEKGDRATVHGLLKTEADPEAYGPKLPWPPRLPPEPGKPKG